ncbi:MAG: mechanosensitive ion channel family protein [Gammaproteobacteria bacterium]
MSRFLLSALLIGLVAAAHGQEQTAAEWIRPEAVPARADELMRRLETIQPTASQRETTEAIDRGVAELEPKLGATAAGADKALAISAPLNVLEGLKRELTGAAEPLDAWYRSLEAEAGRVAALLDQLAAAEARWSETQRRPETADAGEVVENRVQASLDLIRETGERLRVWRIRLGALGDRVVEQRGKVASVLARLEEAATERRTTLLVPDRMPPWRNEFAASLRSELPRAPGVLRAYAQATWDYFRADVRPLAVQLLLATLLALAFHGAGRRVRPRAMSAVELAAGARVLERPISIGVLLALLATPFLQPLAPQRVNEIFALVALIPVARIVLHASAGSPVVFGGLFVLLVLNRLGHAFQPLPALAQATLGLILAVGVALALWILRRGGLLGESWLVRLGGRVTALALSFALLAQLGGWSGLAALIGSGVIASAVIGVYIWAAVLALDALSAWALSSPRFGRLQLGGAEGAVARRRAGQILRWVGAAIWLYIVLGAVELREMTAQGLERILDAGISVGALSLTLGGMLAFALTLLMAPLVARFINVVLDTAVYPRARLARGIPYALSTLVRYAVYVVAFLAALAAAGVQLSQLSILLGGLGVGLGLGLQDIVKNFAAGLTLLIERRVHVGDAVQLLGQQIFGRVLAIGMRATVVRNWDGAEVVVPNADLVSGAVTNWTLSDRLRRIELPVGVAYGTEPERVIALLIEVASGHEQVLAQPPPQALFQGFGESSLDFVLRVWFDMEYDSLVLRSELALATHRSLSEAGITVPFPQRDLHLASVPPELSAVLAGKEGAQLDRARLSP